MLFRSDSTSGVGIGAQSVDLLVNDTAGAGTSFVADSLRLCNATAAIPQVAPNCLSTSFTVTGVGTYALSGTTVTFTPAVGYAGTPDPVAYSVLTNFGQAATSTYTATVSAGGTVLAEARQWGNGNPYLGAGSPVTLLNAGGSEVAATVTGSDGIARFTGLADGTYTVRMRSWQSATKRWTSNTIDRKSTRLNSSH